MLKRRTKKASKAVVAKVSGRQYLVCKECNIEEVLVSNDIAAVTCGYCVQKMIAPPAYKEKVAKSDKPRGWHFKAYFEHEGVVYSKGEVVTDKKEISRLKKSMTDTPAKSVKKVTTKRSTKNARTTK
jgi:ribosomal protein S27E